MEPIVLRNFIRQSGKNSHVMYHRRMTTIGIAIFGLDISGELLHKGTQDYVTKEGNNRDEEDVIALRVAKKEVFAVNALKAIYHDGVVEFIEKPIIQGMTEVLIIFPEKVKKVKKIGGLFKNHFIDHEAVNAEIKSLSRDSQRHLLSEAGE